MASGTQHATGTRTHANNHANNLGRLCGCTVLMYGDMCVCRCVCVYLSVCV
eukprot:m.878214 g.878214  ORF g.878214 m.878214 type:complete len:51 (-) comp23585_c0_seq24:930-1082(-)